MTTPLERLKIFAASDISHIPMRMEDLRLALDVVEKAASCNANPSVIVYSKTLATALERLTAESP